MGAISQHCSPGASLGTACTNTCSSRRETDGSGRLFTNTVLYKQNDHTKKKKKKTHCNAAVSCEYMCVQGERLTCPRLFNLFRKFYGANSQQVNPPAATRSLNTSPLDGGRDAAPLPRRVQSSRAGAGKSLTRATCRFNGRGSAAGNQKGIQAALAPE